MTEPQLRPTGGQSKSADQIVRKLAALLPSQGPITAFAFLNPLQAMEDRPFVEAIREGSELFDCEPFFTGQKYREFLRNVRITREDLQEILDEEPTSGEQSLIAGLISVGGLRLSMLESCISPGTEDELQWVIAETDALRRFHLSVPHHAREVLIAATRKWIESINEPYHHLVARILKKYGVPKSGAVDDPELESVCLEFGRSHGPG